MVFNDFEKIAVPLGILGIKVTQNGQLIGEKLWDGEIRRNIYSASKSFTSCAVGFAVKEGLLSLEERLVDAFSEDMPENISDHLSMATVRDLLTMCLGQENGNLMGEQRPLYKENDWVKMSFEIPFGYKPGTRFVYNNVGPYLAGILVQRRAGCDLVSYLMPRLFQPLEIRRPMWEKDPQGNVFGAGGLFLTLSELHKFGLFYLQKGNWKGKQLLPVEWIETSTKKQVENDKDPYGYGYLFWRGEENAYRADGKYFQQSIICEDKDAVISVVAECRKGEELQKAIFQHIYTQL